MKKKVIYLKPPERICKREGCGKPVAKSHSTYRRPDYCGTACYRQSNTFRTRGTFVFK